MSKVFLYSGFIFIYVTSAVLCSGCIPGFGNSGGEGESSVSSGGASASYDVKTSVDKYGTRHSVIKYHEGAGKSEWNTTRDLASLSEQIIKQHEAANGSAADSIATRQNGSPDDQDDQNILSPGAPVRMGSYADRKKFLLSFIRRPDERAIGKVVAILQNHSDPLAPLAVIAAGKLHGGFATKELYAALDDSRGAVRIAVVSVLADHFDGKVVPACRRMAERDPDMAVRRVAISALGKLDDRVSILLLRKIMHNGHRRLQATAAWSLACMGEEDGLGFLERMALADDPNISPGVVRALATVPSLGAVDIIHTCLFSRHRNVYLAAGESLLGINRKFREKALRDTPKRERERIELRRDMVFCLLRRGRIPGGAYVIIGVGRPSDRRLALRCMAVDGGVRGIPFVIDRCFDNDIAVVQDAQKILDYLVRVHKFKWAPKSTAGKEEWRIWWLKQYALESLTSSQAMLVTPDGKRVNMRQGVRVDWGARLSRIKSGKGENGLDGGYIIFALDGREVRVDG